MLLLPRPRFHLITWSQFVAFVMLLSGIFPYWWGKGGAVVPSTITWRVAAVGAIFVLMCAVPQILNVGPAVIKGIATEEEHGGENFADKPDVVRRLIWWYCLVDLALLTYLVHITGGITGSMYAGLYLLVPSLALLVLLGSADVARAFWLIFWSAAGIALSFLFSHFSEIEYDASHYPHAFDIGLTLVSLWGISLLIVQLLVLKRQFEKQDKTRAEAEKAVREATRKATNAADVANQKK